MEIFFFKFQKNHFKFQKMIFMNEIFFLTQGRQIYLKFTKVTYLSL
jgi:hypothetical protein